MRCLAIAAAFLTLAVTAPTINTPATAAKAKAEPARYCARFRGGAENCGFTSLEQCLQSVRGDGGACTLVQAMPRPKGRLPDPEPMNPRDEDDTE